jgi:hypothetical protein
MHASHATNHSSIFYFHMPSESGQAGDDYVVAQHAVMGYMGLRHDEIVRSEACTTSRLHTPLDDH